MKFKVLSLLALSPIVWATPQEGTVIKMEFGPATGATIHVDMSFNNSTPCANNSNGYDYSFNINTEIGKTMFATFLAAQRSKSNIKVSGTGNCGINSNTEDIRWIQSK
ncbi:hypothetical protein [Alteromonas sp. ASW11-130]|uniref:hypothetical protein n=1 Tax=Alteromonas sp. ASW11-130 TaxID=3015775 RepID=UPI00224186F8|nr:hypothetical protein [Alteromonas sp. ASW11-130]MCW8091863.1 hypothetical protein [Alteromonas sp. ASW11-130]